MAERFGRMKTMAKIWMDDKVGRDKFDPYKDTLVTTVSGTAGEE